MHSLTHWQGANQWFELQDLHVQELLPQMITLAEAYIQVYSLSELPTCTLPLTVDHCGDI